MPATPDDLPPEDGPEDVPPGIERIGALVARALDALPALNALEPGDLHLTCAALVHVIDCVEEMPPREREPQSREGRALMRVVHLLHALDGYPATRGRAAGDPLN